MNSHILKRTNFAAIVAVTAAVMFATSTMATAFEVPLGGETITVTTCNDVSDFSGAQQVSDLPGPDGRVSFREACTAANNTLGSQTIAFAIPVADFWWWTDLALLKSEQGAFFITDSGTTVDFTTQTTNIGDTNPTGLEVMIYNLAPNWMGIPAIFVKGNNCLIKGLGTAYQSGYGVRLQGNNNRVIGSDKGSVLIEGYLGEPIPTGNIVGGTGPGEGNNLTGMRIGGPAENNIVIGNTIIGVNGVDVIGSTQYGIIARNNRIGGPTPAERNIISGASGKKATRMASRSASSTPTARSSRETTSAPLSTVWRDTRNRSAPSASRFATPEEQRSAATSSPAFAPLASTTTTDRSLAGLCSSGLPTATAMTP